MSKASDWLKAKPTACEYSNQTVAQIDANGHAVIGGYTETGVESVRLPAGQALAVARWILDTFADGA